MEKQPLYAELRTVYETSSADPHTYRLAIGLRDPVDGEIFRRAVEKTMRRYPYFRVRLTEKDGDLFYEENPEPVPVLHTERVLTLGSQETGGHHLAFCYSGSRIFIDAFHGLTDGGGIAPMLRTLLYYYCSERSGEQLSAEGIRLQDDPVDPGEWEDPYRTPPARQPALDVYKWDRPALQLADTGLVRIVPECRVMTLRLPEDEFMKFNISNDGSPATVIALLLARAVRALCPDAAEPPVIAMCVNQRPALKAPLAHQSLVGDVRLPYTDRMKELPLHTQATCFRGMVALQSDSDMVLREVAGYRELVSRLQSMEGHAARRAYCRKRMRELSRCLTATVSYVGKANLGDAEKFITDYAALPSTALPSTHVPLTLEISALNGYFFINFMQYFREEEFFRELLRQLQENGISYDVLETAEARYPRI